MNDEPLYVFICMQELAKIGNLECNFGGNVKQLYITMDLIPNLTAMCELDKFLYEWPMQKNGFILLQEHAKIGKLEYNVSGNSNNSIKL